MISSCELRQSVQSTDNHRRFAPAVICNCTGFENFLLRLAPTEPYALHMPVSAVERLPPPERPILLHTPGRTEPRCSRGWLSLDSPIPDRGVLVDIVHFPVPLGHHWYISQQVPTCDDWTHSSSARISPLLGGVLEYSIVARLCAAEPGRSQGGVGSCPSDLRRPGRVTHHQQPAPGCSSYLDLSNLQPCPPSGAGPPDSLP